MKRISLLLTFVAIFATASFAAPSLVKTQLTENKALTYKNGDVTIEVLSFVAGTSCTVSASWTNSGGKKTSIELTVNCESCTTVQEACDQAYRMLSIIIPG